jgi:hypothetical protein
MAAASWRVTDARRAPDATLIVTYTFAPAIPPAQASAPTGNQNANAPAPRGLGAWLARQSPQVRLALVIGVLVVIFVCAGIANALTGRGTQTQTVTIVTDSPTATATTAIAVEDTSTPLPLVSGPHLGGPILDFVSAYGGGNSPGPVYQWNIMRAGIPVQIMVTLSHNGDSVDDQYRAVIIDISTISGSGTPWTATQDAAIIRSFLPSDAVNTRNIPGWGKLGPDHLYTSQQLANSLTGSVFQNSGGHVLPPGTFDWQCSTSAPLCEIAVGTNS